MSENINKTSLDEIVFRDRNKEYGAYVLRKLYKKYTTRSVIISIIILLLAVLIPFFIFKSVNSKGSGGKDVVVQMENLNKAQEDAPPPPPPPPPEAVEQKAKFTAPVVTEDTTSTADLNQDDMNKEAVAAPVSEEVVVEEAVQETKVIEEEINTPIFTVVEEMPNFPGGDESRIKFLKENINYPQMAKESGIQGTVYVTFVINEKGKVDDVKVLRGIGGGCDEEAVRVVRLMPSWNPGKQSGKAVRVQFNMPIKFTLSG